MLKASYDKVFVSKNYLSLIKGHIEIKKGSDVLILAVDNLKQKPHWNEFISLSEINFLKKIGREFEISPLLSLEDYIDPIVFNFSIDGKIIELSGKSSDHMNELSRKLPSLFEPLTELNQEFFNQTLLKYFSDLAPSSEALAIKNKIFLNLKNSKDNLSSTLYHGLQILHQTHFSDFFEEEEFDFLFSRLISPLYKIDLSRLEMALSFEFKNIGGAIKNTQIESFQLENQELKSLILSSFDGIIFSKELSFFSELPEDGPFMLKNKGEIYSSFKMVGRVDHDYSRFHKDKRIAYLSSDKLGSDFPYFEIFFDKNNNYEATFAYKDYQGTKPSIYFIKFYEILFEALNTLFPGLSYEEFKESIETPISSNRWIFRGEKNKGLSPFSKEVCSLNTLPLKNVYYLGDFSIQYLNLHSYLKHLI